MLRAMDSAVAGLRSHQNKLDVIGNNIANVNTFGFKAQSYSFKEAMYQTSAASTGGTDSAAGNNAAQYGYGTMTGSIATDMASGTPSYVGGFNATINGQGFFVVRSSKGDITNEDLKSSGCYFTRVGQFSVDNNGYIVDSANNFVFGFLKADPDDPDSDYQTDTLKPLRLTDVEGNIIEGDDEPAIASSIEINNMGIITAKITDQDGNAKTVTIGKIAIASFQNPEGLTKSGGYYYTTNGNDNAGDCIASEPGSGSTPNLMTGYVEASNVDLAKEFSELIMAQRGFQANSKIITVSDEILNELVNMKR
ncbi:flagellar hook-basal body complex protein [Enterocloster clostridioformis]|uniref:Flagellar hook protein FlgE n=1 Tax=Enterocloster clostridioformis TaxID=1531 RepID=A0AAP9SA23_9FIRM|nr:flagellar hook-basal body complex protein [Enterocloster clostridioformis]EHG33845.1 hypothetical protein HMPREF9467_00381 [ [[Clostridium] clostridioforme 2_1_49FAA]QIX93536.1 flagellar hook-basal body complex protein [Enterocloster clostridioformis]